MAYMARYARNERHVNCRAILSTWIAEEFNNKDFSDVKLVVGNKEFYAHRMFLVKQSEMFRIMFTGSQWVESTQKEVTLNETRECEAVFHDFLSFFYSAKIVLTLQNIVAVRILADKYQHIELLKECDRFVTEVVMNDEIDTIVGWLVNGASLGEKMEEHCLHKLQLKFIKLMTTKTSRSLVNLDLLIKIVDSSNVLVHNELMLFQLVARWIMERRHPASQKSAVKQLLPLIRFQHMTTEQLIVVESSPLSTKYSDIISKYMLEAYRMRALLASSKDKNKSKDKDKDNDEDKERAKSEAEEMKLRGFQPNPRFYTDAPWGNGYTKPHNVFFSTTRDICSFKCPVVDRSCKPFNITKSTDHWDIFYKREFTYDKSEDQATKRILVSHGLSCKYRMIEQEVRTYEIVILTGYQTNNLDGTTFTTITSKKHYSCARSTGTKTRRIDFSEHLKPAVLNGKEYVFAIGIYYKE